MYELLNAHFEQQREAGFLFPGLGARVIKGRIEHLNQDRVTILAEIDGNNVRIVLHPNNTVLVGTAN